MKKEIVLYRFTYQNTAKFPRPTVLKRIKQLLLEESDAWSLHADVTRHTVTRKRTNSIKAGCPVYQVQLWGIYDYE